MKLFNILAIILMTCFSIENTFSQDQVAGKDYKSFGAEFIKKEELPNTTSLYKNMQQKDTITTQLVGEITEVCQAKGCWMKVNLTTDDEVFVKFKDYGFFVPLDASGKKVVMNGNAFIEEQSVEEQKHYAKDKGASKTEIQKITAPKRTLRFEASGVLIK